jgi:hypothetical protein
VSAYTRRVMNRRLFSKWARWLLPLLVARAFLPVGFMLSASQADGLQLVFCPDQVTVVEGHSAGHHGADADQHAGAHAVTQCPFAVAAVAAVIDIPHLDPVAPQATGQFLPERTVAVPLTGPQRADRIRGPPSFS